MSHRKHVFKGLSILCFFNIIGFYFLLKTNGIHRIDRTHFLSYSRKEDSTTVQHKNTSLKISEPQMIYIPVKRRNHSQVQSSVLKRPQVDPSSNSTEFKSRKGSEDSSGTFKVHFPKNWPNLSYLNARPKRSGANNETVYSDSVNESINTRKLAELKSRTDLRPNYTKTMLAISLDSNSPTNILVSTSNVSHQINSQDSVLHSSILEPFQIYTFIKNKLIEKILKQPNPSELLLGNISKMLLNTSDLSSNTMNTNKDSNVPNRTLSKESVKYNIPVTPKFNEINRDKTFRDKVDFRKVGVSSDKHSTSSKSFTNSSTSKPYIDLKNLTLELKEIILSDNKTKTSNTAVSTAKILEALPSISDPKADFCQITKNNSLDLIIFIASAPQNRLARMAIRKTWGHYTKAINVKLLFYLGNANTSTQQQDVAKEDSVYSDIIQDGFVDSYRNLSLKSVRILQWVINNCHHAKFVMKADDDTFVNLPLLIKFLQHNIHKRKAIFGVLLSKRKVIRDPNSKWYISPEEIQKDLYPDFIAGPSYIISEDAVMPLFQSALSLPLFPLEDVFITGFCARKANVRRLNNVLFHNDRGKFHYCDYRNYISFHYVKPHEMFQVWKELNINQDKCPGIPDLINMADPLQSLHKEIL